MTRQSRPKTLPTTAKRPKPRKQSDKTNTCLTCHHPTGSGTGNVRLTANPAHSRSCPAWKPVQSHIFRATQRYAHHDSRPPQSTACPAIPCLRQGNRPLAAASAPNKHTPLPLPPPHHPQTIEYRALRKLLQPYAVKFLVQQDEILHQETDQNRRRRQVEDHPLTDANIAS